MSLTAFSIAELKAASPRSPVDQSISVLIAQWHQQHPDQLIFRDDQKALWKVDIAALEVWEARLGIEYVQAAGDTRRWHHVIGFVRSTNTFASEQEALIDAFQTIVINKASLQDYDLFTCQDCNDYFDIEEAEQIDGDELVCSSCCSRRKQGDEHSKKPQSGTVECSASTPLLPLTQRQAQVFQFIKRFIEENGFPPTRMEISTGFLNAASANAAQCHLDALEKKGWVKKSPGRDRGIRIVGSNCPWEAYQRSDLLHVIDHLTAQIKQLGGTPDVPSPNKRGSHV